ncbi:hypothetical protein D6789_01830 [Candidatus Woesearchaeota archaeon]|nr:MAG: hypothetical protein D6789_01830 [Candidatus Woesearchaeota archaeon]
MTDALAIRKEQKRKKPTFARQDAHKERRIARTGYRRPKGRQSKMRLAKKGYRRTPSQGYRSPVAARGLDRKGLIPVTLSTREALKALDPKREGAVIARTVGDRRREELLLYAKELGITVLNLDVERTLQELAQAFKDRKQAKEKKTLEQQAKKAEQKAKQEAEKAKQRTEPAKVPEEAAGDKASEAKKREEAEKQKILTKKV